MTAPAGYPSHADCAKAVLMTFERHVRGLAFQIAIARDSQLTSEELIAVLDVQPPEVAA